MIKVGLVEDGEEVRDFLKEKYGLDDKMYLKQKMIVATLDGWKGAFTEHKRDD